MTTTTTCTLTLKSDREAWYEDDLMYRTDRKGIVYGTLSTKGLARDVVTLLHRWVGMYPTCRRDELMVLGKALYEIAFPGEPAPGAEKSIRAAFQETFEACRKNGSRLRLRIVSKEDVRALSTYPWEFLYMDRPDDDGLFLAGEDPSLTLTRYVPNTAQWDENPDDDDEDGRVRILVVMSTPAIPRMTDLNVAEVADFVQHLRELDPERFEVVVAPPTHDELRAAIEQKRPHVIHFIGHGSDGRLALTKDAGTLERERIQYAQDLKDMKHPPPLEEAAWIDSATAKSIFKAGLESPLAPRRLIFLHACQTATSSEASAIVNTFNNIARTLAAGDGRITGVIAMQYTIRVDEAERFAHAFYSGISDGLAIDEAVRRARQRFAEEFHEGQQSWDSPGFGIPVSYLRRDDALIAHPASDRRVPTVVAPAPQMRLAEEKEPCPNPSCRDGYVLRSTLKCKRCQEPFIVCPRCGEKPGMMGLVVAKPNYECNRCDYRFGGPVAEPSTHVAAPLTPRSPRHDLGRVSSTGGAYSESRAASSAEATPPSTPAPQSTPWGTRSGPQPDQGQSTAPAADGSAVAVTVPPSKLFDEEAESPPQRQVWGPDGPLP